MVFDAKEHFERQRIIHYGQQKWPEERNITILYQKACEELGIVPEQMTSIQTAKLPAPHETTDETGKLILPKKDCPKCDQKECMNLFPLCATCRDAEGGKYRSKWECSKCGYKDISEKAFVQWLDELEIDFRPGMKADMGIKTATDSGLR